MGLGNQLFGGYKKGEVDEIVKKLKEEKKELLLELRSTQEKAASLERQLVEAQKIITGLEDEIEENLPLFQKEQNKLPGYDAKSLLMDYRGLILRTKNLAASEKSFKDTLTEIQGENNQLKLQISQLERSAKGKQELANVVQTLSESLLANEPAANMQDLELLTAKIKEKMLSSLEIIKERTKLEQQIEKLQRELENSKASNKDLTDQYHSLSNELTGILLKNKELINKIEELQLEVNSLQTVKDKLVNTNNLLKEEIVDLKEKVNSDADLVDNLRGQIEKLQQLNQELEAEIGESKVYKVKIGDVFQRALNISATIEEKVEEEAKRLIQKRVDDFFNNQALFNEVAVGKIEGIEEGIIIEETLAIEDNLKVQNEDGNNQEKDD